MRKPYLKRGYEIYDMYFGGEFVTTGKLIDLAELTPYKYQSLRRAAVEKRPLGSTKKKYTFEYVDALPEPEFFMYKNEEIVGCGTLEELAEKFNVKLATMKYYAAPSAHRRYEGRGTCLVELEDDSY